MSLTGIQKFAAVMGTIAGFIPGVSTITGVAKYFIYRGCAKTCEESRNRLQTSAEKTSSLANKNLNLDREKRDCYESLSKSAIIEAIPGVNFFAAAYSASRLHELFKLDGMEQNPAAQKDYLLEKYHVKPPADLQQRQFLGEIALIVDSLDIQSKILEERGPFITTQKYILDADSLKSSLLHNLAGATSNEEVRKKAPLVIVKWGLKNAIQEQQQKLSKLLTKAANITLRYEGVDRPLIEFLKAQHQNDDAKVLSDLEKNKVILTELSKAQASLDDQE